VLSLSLVSWALGSITERFLSVFFSQGRKPQGICPFKFWAVKNCLHKPTLGASRPLGTYEWEEDNSGDQKASYLEQCWPYEAINFNHDPRKADMGTSKASVVGRKVL